ncbi:MAG: hypothetical protein H6679_04600 [Epsilonproteobacteria bacterium]|nr:hypothetical protein [Campylobacterota bacterium]
MNKAKYLLVLCLLCAGIAHTTRPLFAAEQESDQQMPESDVIDEQGYDADDEYEYEDEYVVDEYEQDDQAAQDAQAGPEPDPDRAVHLRSLRSQGAPRRARTQRASRGRRPGQQTQAALERRRGGQRGRQVRGSKARSTQRRMLRSTRSQRSSRTGKRGGRRRGGAGRRADYRVGGRRINPRAQNVRKDPSRPHSVTHIGMRATRSQERKRTYAGVPPRSMQTAPNQARLQRYLQQATPTQRPARARASSQDRRERRKAAREQLNTRNYDRYMNRRGQVTGVAYEPEPEAVYEETPIESTQPLAGQSLGLDTSQPAQPAAEAEEETPAGQQQEQAEPEVEEAEQAEPEVEEEPATEQEPAEESMPEGD